MATAAPVWKTSIVVCIRYSLRANIAALEGKPPLNSSQKGNEFHHFTWYKYSCLHRFCGRLDPVSGTADSLTFLGAPRKFSPLAMLLKKGSDWTNFNSSEGDVLLVGTHERLDVSIIQLNKTG